MGLLQECIHSFFNKIKSGKIKEWVLYMYTFFGNSLEDERHINVRGWESVNFNIHTQSNSYPSIVQQITSSTMILIENSKLI